jgi:hypothetical protein
MAFSWCRDEHFSNHEETTEKARQARWSGTLKEAGSVTLKVRNLTMAGSQSTGASELIAVDEDSVIAAIARDPQVSDPSAILLTTLANRGLS